MRFSPEQTEKLKASIPVVGPECPYCGGSSKLISSKEIYKTRDYGPMWACENYPKCDAYVGCHPNTKKPLGRLANMELRNWKKLAHAHFDPIWRAGTLLSDKSSKMKRAILRTKAYSKLAKEMSLDPENCHIGMFNVEQCKEVVRLCKEGRINVRPPEV